MTWGFTGKELPGINNMMFSWNGILALHLSRLQGNENTLSMFWDSMDSFKNETQMRCLGHK